MVSMFMNEIDGEAARALQLPFAEGHQLACYVGIAAEFRLIPRRGQAHVQQRHP